MKISKDDESEKDKEKEQEPEQELKQDNNNEINNNITINQKLNINAICENMDKNDELESPRLGRNFIESEESSAFNPDSFGPPEIVVAAVVLASGRYP